MYKERVLEHAVKFSIKHFPVTAIVGSRQCGKSTLIKHLITSNVQSIWLDLELPSDLKKLDDPEWFLSTQKGKLICIDEIQRKPDLFPLIRYLVDTWNTPSCFVILGSASRDMLHQSSESLAGRISYLQLTPFLWDEIYTDIALNDYMYLGGYPRSLLSGNAKASLLWRQNFITTFLERDLLQWAGFTPATMHRLWTMLAHMHGQVVNYSTLSKSLEVSSVTVKNYIDLLESTYMLHVLQPYMSNLGKRLVKSPKVYISDSGLTTALLNLDSYESLVSHPVFGTVWEQIVIQNIKGLYPDAELFFYRTSNGAEIDIVMRLKNNIYAIECKSTVAPTLSKGNYNAIEDIQPKHTFVVCPITESWSMKPNITVIGLGDIKTMIND